MPTIEISESAFSYLKSLAEPFVDTPAMVLDRIISERQNNSGPKRASHSDAEMRYGPRNLPSVAFTKIESAKIDKRVVRKPNWNSLVEGMILASRERGYSSEDIMATINAQVRNGRYTEDGFRYVPEADFSFQGLDADRCCKAIAGLSVAFDISVEITFQWSDNPKAHRPRGIGRIEIQND
ncbi:MAG: hypothetical protein AB7L41_03190 [Flavobacteriaceae bacterium]